MDKKIIIFAGNKMQSDNLISRIFPVEARKKFVCASSAHAIAGIRAESYIEIGTFYEQPDYSDMIDLIKSRII